MIPASVVPFPERHSEQGFDRLPRPLVVGRPEPPAGVPELPEELLAFGIVPHGPDDRAADAPDLPVQDLVLHEVAEACRRGVLVDVVVERIEAGPCESSDVPADSVGACVRPEPYAVHVNRGAVLASHRFHGAVAGRVEDAVPVAVDHDLRAGVPDPRVSRGPAQFDPLDYGVLLQQPHAGLVGPVAKLRSQFDGVHPIHVHPETRMV